MKLKFVRPPEKHEETLWYLQHQLQVFTPIWKVKQGHKRKTFLLQLVCVCVVFLFLWLYCTFVLTKQSTGVSECSDLWVRQASEQGHQGRKEILIIHEAIPTGVHQNTSKFAQAGFETLQQGAWSAQRVVHWLLEEERKKKETRNGCHILHCA